MPAYRPTPWMRCTAKSPGSSSSAIESVRRRVNRGAVRVCRRDPNRSSSVITARLPAANRKPSASGDSTGSTAARRRRAPPAARCERPVPAAGQQQRMPRPRRAPRALASSAALPCAVPQPEMPEVEPLGELGEVQPHVRRRAHRRAGAAPGPPATRSPRRALRPRGARPAGPIERALGVGQHDPRALGQQLGRRGHAIEQERRERLRSLDEQPVGEPLRAGRRSAPARRQRRLRAVAQGVIGDQLAGRRHARRARPDRSRAGSTARTP